jgi:hypothetical protein
MPEKTVTLDDQDWLVIDQALQQMPYRAVVGVFQRMNEQFAKQLDQGQDGTASADGMRRVLRADA